MSVRETVCCHELLSSPRGLCAPGPFLIAGTAGLRLSFRIRCSVDSDLKIEGGCFKAFSQLS